MDYGLFRSFKKISPASWPRTSQEQGLFLLELAFVPEGETRSISAPLEIELSGFGEVLRLHVGGLRREAAASSWEKIRVSLQKADPPITLIFDAGEDRVTFTFLAGPPKRNLRVPGVLIFDASGELTTLVARLHDRLPASSAASR